MLVNCVSNRWRHIPLDDAISFHHDTAVEILQKHITDKNGETWRKKTCK